MGRYNSLPYCRAWCGAHAMVITSIGTVEANKGRAPSQTSRQNAMPAQETHDWPFKVDSKDFFSALPNSCDSRLAIQSEFRRFLLRTKPGRPYLASDISPSKYLRFMVDIMSCFSPIDQMPMTKYPKLKAKPCQCNTMIVSFKASPKGHAFNNLLAINNNR